MTAGRIRVLIAGNIYVKRALVRRFLEDDGYEVVAEAFTRGDILPAIGRGSPDAIVVEDALLEDGSIARIRSTAPDAKIVVFTSTPPASPGVISGADAYLEKGVALASLTALLGRLFEPDRAPLALVGAGAVAGAAIATEASAPTDSETIADNGGSGSSTPAIAPARLTAIAGGAILIVVGLVAMITSGGNGTEPAPGDTTDQTGGTVIAEPAEETELDEAYLALDNVIAAIEGGNYVLATVEAQSLMDAREAAFAAGFTTSGLDAEITARLTVVVVDIPAGAATNLQAIVGDLYPVLEDESEPGGGSDVVLAGPVTDEGGSTDGSGDTNTDGSGGSGGDVGTVTLGPGDGRRWGQSHKPPPGGWGGPPPWSNGHHDKSDK
jgi:hypothetical protein